LTKKTKKQKRNLVHAGLVHNVNLGQVKELLCMK
jgi:large subunit ribosomal protein L35